VSASNRGMSRLLGWLGLLAGVAGGCNLISGVGDYGITGASSSGSSGGAGGSGGSGGSGGETDGGVDGGSTPGATVWAHRYGAAGLDTRGSWITVGADNALRVSGLTTGGADFGGGLTAATAGAFVATVGLDGVTTDVKSFTTGTNVNGIPLAGPSVLATDQGLVVAGLLTGSIDFGDGPKSGDGSVFVVAFEPTGMPLWSRVFGTGMAFGPPHVADDGAGGVYLSFEGKGAGSVTLKTTHAGDDAHAQAFVARIDGAGTVVWDSVIGNTSGYVYAGAMAADATGVYVGGKIDSGSVSLGCPTPLTSGTNYSMYVVKYTAAGACAWNRAAGADTPLAALVADGKGAVYAVGNSRNSFMIDGVTVGNGGAYDAYVVKLDAQSGQAAWGRAFGGAGDQLGDCVAHRGTRVLVGGHFRGDLPVAGDVLVSAHDNDLFFALLDDATGTPVFGRSFSNTTAGSAYSYKLHCAIAPGGDALLAGALGGTIDFDAPHAITSLGPSDAFAARIAGK
jgi:hypothetical protein